MKARTFLGLIVMMFFIVNIGKAGGKDEIQKYFNDTACKVKATTDPAQKREILNKSLQTMSKALDKVQSSQLISKDDCASIDRFKSALQEKQDELTGSNGYERVSNAQLNSFSDYVVQDMEQAAETVTISVITAILIGVIVLLLVAVL